MLAGNKLKICVDAHFEISSTLVNFYCKLRFQQIMIFPSPPSSSFVCVNPLVTKALALNKFAHFKRVLEFQAHQITQSDYYLFFLTYHALKCLQKVSENIITVYYTIQKTKFSHT